MKKNGKSIILWIIVFAAVIIASTYMFDNTEDEIVYSDIKEIIETGEYKDAKVEKLVIDRNGNLVITYDNKTKTEHPLKNWEVFYRDNSEAIDKLVKESDGEVSFDMVAPTSLPWWFPVLAYGGVIVLLIVLWRSFISRASSKDGLGGGGGFGGRMNSFTKAKPRLGSDEKNKVYFKDVAGADEEKEELKEIVDFLKNPGKYTALGARIPKGVLLVGAPGTGKTLLAKAVAGEADVPFYSISGSDFVEMYVGLGASRVRDLFETAKKTTPAIIFIDEIDAVGRHRGAGWGGGHDEREQTLNQLLVEMDGFGGNAELIIMAATNRPDILDPALLRPGRFDRQITINYPDLKGRVEILKVHARNKKFAPDVDFETIAKSTVGFSGADLANLLNEAALLSARRNKDVIGTDELEDANLKIIVGPKKTSRIIKDSEKKNTAYHEAGHAVVGHFLPTQDPVRQISIIPSGRALGYTLSVPEEDKYSVYKTEMMENIAMLLGGRVAEKLILGDISGGASNDIQRATEIARKMVTQLGMSDVLGPIVFGTGNDEVFLGKDFNHTRNYSETVAAQIDEEIHKIISKGYETAEQIITEHMNEMHFIADYLVANEVMDGEQFAEVFKGDPTFEKLDAIKANRQKANRVQAESSETVEDDAE